MSRTLTTLALITGLVAAGPVAFGPVAAGPVAFGSAPVTAADRGTALVRTDAGWVRGVVGDGHRTFPGVPYAAPPVGDLRWRAPQPVTPWRGVHPEVDPKVRCAQNSPGPVPTPSGVEDCLYLTVTTPSPRRAPRPVLVWLHGGNFQNGAGTEYDSHRLATDGDTVVVTVNYRLGVFGYFGIDGLPGSGTFGLQDQQAALHWVRRNIAAFGGDPHNITLAGQSAGGLSVCAQLTSPSAAGLFHKAVIQSGSCLTDWPAGLFLATISAGAPFAPIASVREAGRRLAAAPPAPCLPEVDAMACLRSQKPYDLLAATPGVSPHAFVNPAYGTGLLPVAPAAALRAGSFHRMPVLSGGNLDEHRSLIGYLDFTTPVTDADYRNVLRTAFGDRADEVAGTYPVDHYDSPLMAWAAVGTDRIWACPTLAGDRLLARHSPVFGYEYAERDDSTQPFPGAGWGAFHGAELPSLFDVTFSAATPPPALAAEMVATWARFAATGSPESPGAGRWPRFDAAAAVAYVRTLAVGAHSGVDLAAEHHCGLWATFPSAGAHPVGSRGRMNIRSYRRTPPDSSRLLSAATNSGSMPNRAR